MPDGRFVDRARLGEPAVGARSGRDPAERRHQRRHASGFLETSGCSKSGRGAEVEGVLLKSAGCKTPWFESQPPPQRGGKWAPNAFVAGRLANALRGALAPASASLAWTPTPQRSVPVDANVDGFSSAWSPNSEPRSYGSWSASRVFTGFWGVSVSGRRDRRGYLFWRSAARHGRRIRGIRCCRCSAERVSTSTRRISLAAAGPSSTCGPCARRPARTVRQEAALESRTHCADMLLPQNGHDSTRVSGGSGDRRRVPAVETAEQVGHRRSSWLSAARRRDSLATLPQSPIALRSRTCRQPRGDSCPRQMMSRALPGCAPNYAREPRWLLGSACRGGNPERRDLAAVLRRRSGSLTAPHPRTVASPRPVPRPRSLVVKYGSKMRASVASSMPTPLSLTAIDTKRPSRASG